MVLSNYQEKKTVLCNLLEEAACKLDSFGKGPVWSSYESGGEMAKFLRNRIIDIENDYISREYQKELWGIFAPTCDWDDTTGDVNLGNHIFELIVSMYMYQARTGTEA